MEEKGGKYNDNGMGLKRGRYKPKNQNRDNVNIREQIEILNSETIDLAI